MGEVRMDLYLKIQRWRYHRGNQEVKKRILDEFCETHGYHRFDNPKLVKLMNDLYANEISLLFNFFYPCIKLIDKVRIQSRIKKKYDKPKTPYQRLMASSCLTLDQKKIQKKLKLVFRLVNVQ
ncbi:hypothetical protein EP47_05915 [Legionella norrlandica]|uniref:Uncharacterized protein n=1 Tax=Legionella norrlandica TaxID=1498499 RepID=A0A0A2SSM7_9GAMM|nr:hypothetical protein [Legionella norrlandica]KGP63757.1 hypothetical protein EP47_05915 [Legionella norrlandica]